MSEIINAEVEEIKEETEVAEVKEEKHPVRDFFKTKLGKVVAGTGLALAALVATVIVLGRENEDSSNNDEFGVPGPNDDVSDEATTIEF